MKKRNTMLQHHVEEIISVRSDAIIATGRSDYNNQVNNVLCFPYIFRGAFGEQYVTNNKGEGDALLRKK